MYKEFCVVVIAAVVQLATQKPPASPPEAPWVAITAGSGANKGGFVPEPTALKNPQQIRPRSVFFVNRPTAKTADGQIISGMAFEGWKEKEAVRVVVYSLVPKPGEPNANLGGDVGRLQKRELVQFVLKVGDRRTIVEMAAQGMDPLVVRIDPHMPPNMLHR